MRRFVQLLLAILLLSLAACSNATATSQATATTQTTSQETATVQPHITQILAIGDSLTGGFYASVQAKDYLSLVTTALHAQAIDTHGTYGASALRTLPELVASPPPSADIMIVELGTNAENGTDAATLKTFADTYAQILSILIKKNPHAPLVCLGTWQDHSADTRDAAIKSACEAAHGVYRPLMPLYFFPGFIYHGPQGRSTWLGTGDWFHPNDKGHAAIALLVENALSGKP